MYHVIWWFLRCIFKRGWGSFQNVYNSFDMITEALLILCGAMGRANTPSRHPLYVYMQYINVSSNEGRIFIK